MSETMVESDDVTGQAVDLGWERSYDRVSVERFLDDAAARRAELETQLAAVLDRIQQARDALERRNAARSAELAAIVAEAHRKLAALEADHEAAVEAVRAAARHEVDGRPAGAPRTRFPYPASEQT